MSGLIRKNIALDLSKPGGVLLVGNAADKRDLADKSDMAKGGALLGHNATMNYAVGTIGAILNDIAVNVKMFPWLAKGDGVTDDTAAIQAAFNASSNVFIPKGDYRVNPIDANYPTQNFGGGVKPQNNSTIRFAKRARLIIAPNAASAYVIMNLRDTVNVTIYDGEVVGDNVGHSGSTGEYGMGYYVASATNPRLFNCKASLCWGDGFYVGYSIETSTLPTVGGILAHCTADDNRRQGLSITSWSKGMVLGGEYKNTGATKFTQPAYGIDIEPDNSGVDMIDVTLIGVNTSGNKYGGLQLVPGFMSADTYTRAKYNVNVIGFKSFQDGGGSLRFAYPGLTQAGVNVANKIYGQINVSNAKIVQSLGRGVDFARWVPNAPDVMIDGIEVIDCNTSGLTDTTENQCGIVLFQDDADIAKQTSIGKVTIKNAQITDTRAAPKMLLPIQAQCGAGQSFSNLRIIDPSGSGWASSGNSLLRVVNAADVSVVFSTLPKKDHTVTTFFVNGAWAGYANALTVSSVLGLPPATESVGLEYIFENRYGVTMQIRPTATDTILNYGLFAGNDVVLRNTGDFIKMRAMAAGVWEVTQNVGSAVPLGYGSPGRVLYGTAAPVANAWNRGDRIANVVPSVGAPKGWVCTLTGTPGTWVSEGNL